MSASSKLLINEHPLQALPTLARLLDLNKAVILQQIQYWISTSPHEIEGHQWIYNSYTQWSKQFPWLTPRGVRYHIRELEKAELLIAGEFNRDSRDNTKWYRINYDRLEALTLTSGGLSQIVTPTVTNRQVQVSPNVSPLPETTSKTTPETTIYIKNKHGLFENVLLTESEHKKLIDKFGPDGARERIESLSHGIASKGYKYKSHYATILNWERRDKKGTPRISTDPDKYIKGKYGHLVRR